MPLGTRVSLAPEVPQSRGSLCISIDLEGLWGTWDRVTPREATKCGALERLVVLRLLELFDRYRVPATWAIVGRLFDASRGFDGLLGPRDGWYLPDLVDQIRNRRTAHEIGSHSYGHVYFHQIEEEAASEDLVRAADLHRRHGLSFDSFVFPRNGVSKLDALRRAGIRVFRSVDAGILKILDDVAPRLRPLANLGEKILGLPAPLVLPRVQRDHGLVELPSSTLLLGRQGVRRTIRPSVMRQKLVRATQRAAEQKKVFHLWFHPSNFYDETDTQLAILESALAEAAALRDKGNFAVLRMGDFAAAASVS
ncbi:MAG: polysaccharide deacetylase family protein [Polyangiaceae bacterium]|nr:polysaccharide deacetylase family protein [Polyangiaceae bacterium]